MRRIVKYGERGAEPATTEAAKCGSPLRTMSGHSKWAQIKRQKGANDQKRGQSFTKLAAAVTVAAREKGGDPEMNFGLRLAVDRAKAANMPKDNIERAIKRGTGELGGAQLEDLTYEAYGPEGVALLIQALTDNKNRALGEVKIALNKHGGKMASGGSVQYLFKPAGHILLKKKDFDRQFEIALEAGADDVQEHGEFVSVETRPSDLQAVRQALLSAGQVIGEAELTWLPTTTATLSEAGLAQLDKLEEALDEADDVVKVIDNAA